MRADDEGSQSGQNLGVKSNEMDRRQFLTWTGWASVATAVTVLVGQILRFLAFEPPGGESPILPLGLPADFPAGKLGFVADAKLYVGRDKDGLYAIDAVCTHLGCLVERDESGRFHCPCHGSFFDPQGLVQTGPANSSLPHLNLYLDEEGQLMVDRDRPVERTTRLDA